MVLNVLLQHGSDPSGDIIAGSMADAELDVRVLEAPESVEHNAIVMGGAVAGLRPPLLLVAPEMLQDELRAELELMQIRTVHKSSNSLTGSKRAGGFPESQTP